MQLINNLLKSWVSISLFFIVFFCSGLSSPALIAADMDPIEEVSGIVARFSAKYCAALPTVGDPQKAIEVTSRQMISGLIFSGDLNKVMSVPTEDMAEYVTTEIFDACGSDLSISRHDLNNYLVELAESGEAETKSKPEPFKPFGVG